MRLTTRLFAGSVRLVKTIDEILGETLSLLVRQNARRDFWQDSYRDSYGQTCEKPRHFQPPPVALLLNSLPCSMCRSQILAFFSPRRLFIYLFLHFTETVILNVLIFFVSSFISCVFSVIHFFASIILIDN